jgi:hypothetical protein
MLKIVVILFGSVAFGLAARNLLARPSRVSNNYDRLRWNSLAVMCAALMVLVPLILSGVIRQQYLNWVGVLFAGLALVFLLLGERSR